MKLLKEIDEERLKFVRFWAKIVRETNASYWSQQKILIDSALKSACQNKELYMKVKKLHRKFIKY